MPYFDMESVYYKIVNPFLGRSNIQEDTFIWPHSSKLAFSWTILIYSILLFIGLLSIEVVKFDMTPKGLSEGH